MIRQWCFRTSAPEIEGGRLPAALPPPPSKMLFGRPPSLFPLRIIVSSAAATPAVKLPALPICVCAQGTLYGVHRYELLATYMHPVGPTRMVLSPAALLVILYWMEGPQPAQVR